jgi:hypothetical protein
MYNTNPGGAAATQVGPGPRQGNASFGGKRGEFMAHKASLQGLSSELTERVAVRGRQGQGTYVAEDDGLMASVKRGRGPTRGNG